MNWADFYLDLFSGRRRLQLSVLVFGKRASPFAAHPHSFRPPTDMRRMREGAGSDVINFGTIAAFLAWFGGTGYLLSAVFVARIPDRAGRRSGQRVRRSGHRLLVPGQVSGARRRRARSGRLRHDRRAGQSQQHHSPVGTGEMIFSQMGSRRAAPARSESG